jgi:hypothetical protein
VDTRAALVVEVTGNRRGRPGFLGLASISPDGYDLAYDERNAPRLLRPQHQLLLINRAPPRSPHRAVPGIENQRWASGLAT